MPGQRQSENRERLRTYHTLGPFDNYLLCSVVGTYRHLPTRLAPHPIEKAGLVPTQSLPQVAHWLMGFPWRSGKWQAGESTAWMWSGFWWVTTGNTPRYTLRANKATLFWWCQIRLH